MNRIGSTTGLLLISGIIVLSFAIMFQTEVQSGTGGETLSRSDFVRFHVIANSNSDEDQELKLKVRDSVLEQIAPIMVNMKDAKTSREWLAENTETVNNIAEKTIRENGYSYGVNSGLGMRLIPDKYYGSVVMPAGNYEAFTVEIGSASGENWWCVMFPPLCLVGEDISEDDAALLEERFKNTKYETLIEDSITGKPYILKFKTAEIGSKIIELLKK